LYVVECELCQIARAKVEQEGKKTVKINLLTKILL
jgi:hypothetical protein